jgi:tetratricopeptide (TPR) repeat protein
MALRDQVTEVERFHIEATEAMLEDDEEAQIDLYGRILRINPRDGTAHLNRSIVLARQRRYEEAVPHYEALAALFPQGEATRGQAGHLTALLNLGRFEEARAHRSPVTERTWHEIDMVRALAAGEWAVAESLGFALQHDPEALVQGIAGWRWAQASAQAARGAVRAADSTLLALPSHDHGRARLVLALATGCELALGRALPEPQDLVGFGPWWNASIAMQTGHGDLAAELLASDPATRDRREGPHPRTVASGLEQGRNGDWLALVAAPYPDHARQGIFLDYGTLALRWLVADAYERLGQPDSAAVYFHMVTDSASFLWREHYVRGFAYPFAQRRLAFLYSELGDRRRAQHHWNLFTTTFTDPDPELLWLLEESPLRRRLLPRQARAGAVASEGLFSDRDRACASIEAGRIASLERALSSTAEWFEEYFAQHGHYPTEGFPGLPGEVGRGGQLLIHTQVNEVSWTAAAVDLRDTRVCHMGGGEGAMAAQPGSSSKMVCVQRTSADAYREDLATLALRRALGQLAAEVRTARQTHDTFPPDLPTPSGPPQQLRSGEFFIAQQHPEVRIEILETNSGEIRAVATHPDSPARCTLRMTNTLQGFLGC